MSSNEQASYSSGFAEEPNISSRLSAYAADGVAVDASSRDASNSSTKASSWDVDEDDVILISSSAATPSMQETKVSEAVAVVEAGWGADGSSYNAAKGARDRADNRSDDVLKTSYVDYDDSDTDEEIDKFLGRFGKKQAHPQDDDAVPFSLARKVILIVCLIGLVAAFVYIANTQLGFIELPF
ncbi:MAG: hypothetical protein FWD43_03365 [Coriobacteriia bacterium]|nr:hypothetical protein [Coriobacteriia bacterium]